MNRIVYLSCSIVVCAMLLVGPFAAGGSGLVGSGTAHSQDWKAEFDDICAGANDPMALSAEDLKKLIARCDKLKPLIEGLDETQRRVYLKRLKMCRDVLAFALESKETK